MKVTELTTGQLFKFPKKRNYLKFLGLIKSGNNFFLSYEDSKGIGDVEISSDLEVEVSNRFSLKNYASIYTTCEEIHDVVINGIETKISFVLEENKKLIYIYAIMAIDGQFLAFDVRNVPEFNYSIEEMIQNGINLVKKEIKNNPNFHEYYLQLMKENGISC